MTVLIVAENKAGALHPAVYNLARAAGQIGGDFDVLVTSDNVEALAKEAAQIEGVRKVLTAQADCFAHDIAENTASQVLAVAEVYSHILFVADPTGKAAAPRVAAKLDVAQISEVIKVVDPKVFERPIYAGSVIATVKALDDKVVATVRPTAFDPVGTSGAGQIQVVEPVAPDARVTFVSRDAAQTDRPDLQSSRFVIAGGRGLADEKDFAELEETAAALGAAVGTTRAVVDAGLAPNDWQIGQTGKIIAPDLYIALGISGAIQHTAGIKDAKVIVAVNKDPEAPIFEVADYGLTLDAMDALRELKAKLS